MVESRSKGVSGGSWRELERFASVHKKMYFSKSTKKVSTKRDKKFDFQGGDSNEQMVRSQLVGGSEDNMLPKRAKTSEESTEDSHCEGRNDGGGGGGGCWGGGEILRHKGSGTERDVNLLANGSKIGHKWGA